MKTRIIQTSFWRDTNGVMLVSKNARLLWIFLLTNEYIGMSNYAYIPDIMKSHHTGLTLKEIDKAKKEIQSLKKVFFFDDWVFIKNLEERNSYKNSPKNETSYKNEIDAVPKEVKSSFNALIKEIDSSIDSSIDTSIDSSIDSTRHSTLNTKIENLNTKIKKETDQILEKFNLVTNKNFKSSTSWESNFKKWRDDFSMEEILKAIENMPRQKWFRENNDAQNPTVFFRTSNDWITQCLNYKPNYSLPNKIA